MPRKDDERRPRQGDVNPPKLEGLVRVFDWSKQPAHLVSVLDGLQVESFGQEYPKAPGWRPWGYQPGLRLALEHLRKIDEIPDAPVFDTHGDLRPDVLACDLKDFLITDKILKGKRVIVFGGPEAEVFQAMGAEAVGFDPQFKNLSDINWRADQRGKTLADAGREISNGWADFTYSSRFLDPGSGLVVVRRDKHEYIDNLEVILRLTKPGGLSIHDGEGVFNALHPDLESLMPGRISLSELEATTSRDLVVREIPVRVVEIAPYASDDEVGDSLTTYVLQRKAA